MLNSRSIKIFVVALGMMAMPYMAQAKELVAATIGPASTPYGQGLQKFGERLEELTDGGLTVRIYTNGQLGGSNEIFEQLKGGQLDIGIGIPGIMAQYAPKLQALVVPFVFRDFEHWKRTVNGQVGDRIKKIIKEKSDIQTIGFFGGAVRNLITQPEVSGIEDLEGLRIRLHPSEITTTAWGSLGVRPTVMAYGEVYSGLQLGVIDGLLNEPEWILRMKFYEQAKYYVLTEHEITTRPLLFSNKTFSSLTPEYQQAVLQAGKEAAEFEQELEHTQDTIARQKLAEDHGMTLVDVDKEKFRGVVHEAIEPVLKKQGLKEIVDEILAQ